ncbi:MAG: DUF2177 family protein [Rhodothalassiaceae bacterium]
MTYLIAYAVALVFFLAVDALWIGLVLKNLYNQQVGHLMAEKPNFGWALGFYLFYIIGIIVFAVKPGLAQGWPTALGYGLLFGGLAYATYDFTNLAVLKDWPIGLAVGDVVWGAVLTGATATVATLATKAITS